MIPENIYSPRLLLAKNILIWWVKGIAPESWQLKGKKGEEWENVTFAFKRSTQKIIWTEYSEYKIVAIHRGGFKVSSNTVIVE